MKRILAVILLGITVTFTTFGADNILIVYFSRTGTTENLAKQIQQETLGDIFKIEVVNPYPEEYRATTDQAKRELNEGYLPPVKEKVENLEKYDTIFLGYPIWWGTMPMPVFTFLKENNFDGKKVIPFVTHRGSRLGRSVLDLTKELPNSSVEKNGIAVRGNVSQREIARWVKEILK